MSPETRSTIGTATSIAVAVIAGALASYVAPVSKAPVDLIDQLKYIATLALFVERAVQVWLGITGNNGPERIPLSASERSGQPAGIEANRAALLLGLLLAFTGVRILPSLGIEYRDVPGLLSYIQAGIDIFISGAMIAGGSVLVHEVTEAIKGGIRKAAIPVTETAVSTERAVTAEIASKRAYEYSILASALTVEDVCVTEYEANKDDCNKFAKAVASKFNIQFAGQANDIVDQITGAGWTKLNDGVQAKAMADAGMLVIAGLKGQEHNPPRTNGHVAIVVTGPLAHNKYPTGYWGSSGGSPGKKQTLNYSWNSSDRDNVKYAAHPV